MKKALSFFILFLLIISCFTYAKDPIKRGKGSFDPNKGYPQVDISGYEELEFNKMDQSGNPKYYENTSEYKSLPSSVRVYDGFRHRLLLDIEGQINPKLYIRYKILQEPEIPQETDIYVEYDKFSIYFGKYDATLKNGDLFSLNKNIDGLHADYLEDNYQLEAIYGEERSHKKDFSFYGSGKKEYSLGQTNILEGSVVVRLNNEDLSEQSYSIDYFDGKIIFDRILSSTDKIEGHYEYLDPIEDFLPISSKVRLAGLQHKYKMYKTPEAIFATRNSTYQYSAEENLTGPAPWENLIKNTSFYYLDNNFGLDVRGEELKNVKVSYKDQNFSLVKINNSYSLKIPDNKKQKKVLVEYETEKYTFAKEYLVEFQEKTVTNTIIIESPTINQTVSTTLAPTANNTPSFNQQTLLNSVKIVTSNAVIPSINILSGYKITMPEGLVVLNQESFSEGSFFSLDFLPAVSSINEVELQFKNGKITLLKNNLSYSGEYRLNDDYSPGINYCYLVIKYKDTEQSKKIAFFVTPDPARQKTIKKIALPNFPLISFSEQININDKKLNPGKDYTIDYERGLIKITTDIPRESTLSVNYIYRESLFAQEVFKGADSKGPYNLANKFIVPGSIEIKVSDMYLIELDDFTVNYPNGEIIFKRKIKEIEPIVVRYKYFVIANKNALTNKQENFDISSFIVQESAKSAEASAENNKSLSGSELTITSNTTITTINIPIEYLPVIENSLTLYINDVATSSIRSIYYYNGLITLTGNYTAANIRLDFNYGKTAYAPKEYFNGNSQSSIDLNLKRPIVYGSVVLEHKSGSTYIYTPLVYKKDYFIGEIWDLTAGKADANGYAIVADNYNAWQRGIITFITGNISSGYSTYSGYGSSDQFRLTYKISDANRPDPGDITHQTYGTKINYRPIQEMKLGLEYNESVKRFQRQIVDGDYTTTGNNLYGQEISLPPGKELVEDSEQVFINNRLKTRNEDYSINYKTASIRFKTTTKLAYTDSIEVKYRYYDTGLGDAENFQEKGRAVKVDSSIYLENTNINLTYVTVNSGYDPVGNLPGLYGSGTEAKKIDITTKPLNNLQLYARGEILDNKVGQYSDDSTKDRMKNTVIQQYRADYKINQTDDFSILANRTDVTLPSTTVNSGYYEQDTKAYDYQSNLNVGPENFRSTFFLKNAEAFTDVLDKQNGTKSFNWNRSIKNIYKPFSILSFRTGLDNNIDNQFTNIRKFSETKAYNEYISFTPWTVDTSLELSESEYNQEQSVSETDYYKLNRSLGRDKKQIYNLTFRRPPEWGDPVWQDLYFHFDDTYSNIASDLYNQKPNINRANNVSWVLRPYDFISLGIENKYSRSFLDNFTRDDFLQEKIYRFSKFYPTKYIEFFNDDFLIVNKVETAVKLTNNKKSYPSGETIGSTGIDESNSLIQSYSLNPLDNLSLGIDFSEKKSKKTTTEQLTTGIRKTIYNEPQNSSGLDLDYELDTLFFAEQFHYNWARDMSSRKSHKKLYETTGVLTATIDDLENLNDKIITTYHFDKFSNRHNLDRTEEFKQKDGEGSRYSYGQTDKFYTTYQTPIDGLNVSYGLSKLYNLQFNNPDKNTSRRTLPSNFDDKLLRFDDTHSLSAEYTPISILSFDLTYYTRKITQKIRYDRTSVTTNSFISGVINSSSYEFGSTYRPFTDFSIRYGWRRDIYDLGLGEQSKFTVEWKPAKFDLGTFTYFFENLFTYGKGINDPEQEAKMRELQGFVQSSVTERNDIMVRNTLTFKINKEIANIIVDDMVADINLTRLNFWDKINNDYSYSINAFYAKLTLRF